MTTETKKVLGGSLMAIGTALIVLTAGRVDWEDSVPWINPKDIMPFWQIILQAGIGLALLLAGNCLRKATKRTEAIISRIN